MQKNININDLIQHYRDGDIDRKELEEKIFRYINQQPHQFHLRFEKEERLDFLTWLYPRIHRAIDRYEDKGRTFEDYMGALIHWAIKEYFLLERKRTVSEEVYWTNEGSWLVQNEGSSYANDENLPPLCVTNKRLVKNKRQMLIMLLKSYRFVSEEFIDRIIPYLGVEKEKVQTLLSIIREKNIQREERVHRLQEAVKRHYYRYLVAEQKLTLIPKESEQYEEAKQRRDNARKRLNNSRTKLNIVSKRASNRQIAEVLGIPKGTVDSNVFLARKRITKFFQKVQKSRQ
ncbi:MAG: hypothetical protein LBQ77_07885 [Treponema sp.]|nr:hypothetical protein [Treponema sp.]